MKSRITFLAPGRAAQGMTLAAAVLDKDGNVLLAAGAILDSSILDRLSRRGIEAIAVLLLDTRDAPTIAEEIARAEARVAHIFRSTGGSARDALQAAILLYRQESTR